MIKNALRIMLNYNRGVRNEKKQGKRTSGSDAFEPGKAWRVYEYFAAGN